MCRKHGHSLALTVLLVVAAQAWQYDPDFMANANMQLQPPMLPNYGMDPLGVFSSPMPMNAPPTPAMMVPDPTIDFDSQLMPPQPLQSNEFGVPRFAQQQPEVSTVVVQRRAGGFVARPGEEMVPQTECREGEPGCGPPQVIETATTTTATPIDEDKGKEQREEWERERRERREKDEKRKREKQEEEDKKKKEKEEREEKRRREREEKEEQDKKEKEEREERHRREREEKEERDKERREKRREEDERDRKSFEDDDDEKDSGKHRKRKHRKDDDDEDDGKKDDKKKKGSKCSKCSKCQKKKKDEDGGSGSQKDEGTIEHDGKTIHVVVSTKDEKDDKDKEDGDCEGKKSEGEGDCGCGGGDDEEGEKQKEDPLTAEKKKEYEKLTQMIKKDEEEFSKEADWLTKALSLIGELKQKTHNVQMHLNDLHKDMSLMEHKRQHAAAELEEAEKKKGEEEGLHKMEKELDLLMAASNAANEKINMLSSRKAQYMAKIGEVRNMLQEIKLRHMAANPSAFQSMAESFRSPPPPPAGEQQEDDKMEVVPQFRF